MSGLRERLRLACSCTCRRAHLSIGAQLGRQGDRLRVRPRRLKHRLKLRLPRLAIPADLCQLLGQLGQLGLPLRLALQALLQLLLQCLQLACMLLGALLEACMHRLQLACMLLGALLEARMHRGHLCLCLVGARMQMVHIWMVLLRAQRRAACVLRLIRH